MREIFPSGDAQACFPTVFEIAQAIAGVPRSPPLAASYKQAAAAVSGMLLSQASGSHELHKTAYKRESAHLPATSKNSENVSTGMNSSWKVFRALSAASCIGMSLCRMNSARE